MLALGSGKTRTGRLWTFVRDEHPHDGARPPAAVFFASPDRRGERPLAHLAGFSGVLVVDGYAGFNGRYEKARPGGPLTVAACWRMCGARSSTCMPRPARRWLRRR